MLWMHGGTCMSEANFIRNKCRFYHPMRVWFSSQRERKRERVLMFKICMLSLMNVHLYSLVQKLYVQQGKIQTCRNRNFSQSKNCLTCEYDRKQVHLCKSEFICIVDWNALKRRIVCVYLWGTAQYSWGYILV